MVQMSSVQIGMECPCIFLCAREGCGVKRVFSHFTNLRVSSYSQCVWWRELGRWKNLMHFDWDGIIMAGQLSQKPSNHKDQGVLPNNEGLYTLRDKPCVDDMVL